MTIARWAVGTLAAATGVWAAASCLDPTQITLSISTNAKCAGGFGTNIYVGADPTVSATTDHCDTVDDKHNAIGTIVVVPGGSQGPSVTLRVVGTMAPSSTSADRCGKLFDKPSLSAAEKTELHPCIEARRALSFVSHSMLKLPVSLDAACAGVVCLDTQTCVEGKCVDDTVDCVSDTCGDPDGGGDSGADASEASVLPAVPTSIYANGDATCVITAKGNVQCWGGNKGGKMSVPAPPDVLGAPTDVGLPGMTMLSLGFAHGCGINTGGDVLCWGDNTNGEVDPTNPGSSFVNPVTLTNPTAAVSIAAGTGHSCAVAASGGGTGKSVFCWGDDMRQQLGPLANGDFNELVLSDAPVAVAAGSAHTCALVNGSGLNGLVYCWGLTDHGQAGSVATGEHIQANSVAITNNLFVAAGADQSAAGGVKSLYWWGDDTNGKASGRMLGVQPINKTASVATAMAVADIVTIGDNHMCGVWLGAVTCWGEDLGQLGGHSSSGSTTAVTLTKPNGVKKIAAGHLHTCAIAPSSQDVTRDTVWCWGDNANSQLGGAASGPTSIGPVELTLAPDAP